MAKRSIIGLAIEGDEIRLTSLVKKGGRYVVKAVDTVSILELKKTLDEKETDLAENEDEDVFGIDDLKTEETDFLGAELTNDDENFGGEWTEGADSLASDEDVFTKTIYELDQAITSFGGKKFDIGLAIPTVGLTYDRLSIPADIKKEKEVRKYIEQKICTVYGYEYISSDHYRYSFFKNKDVLVTTYTQIPLLLDLFERLHLQFPNKYFIKSIIPEDLALQRLIDKDIKSDDENTVFINLTYDGARISFLKGTELLSTMPIISRPKTGKAYVNKVYSRLVMELEKGKIQYVTRFVVRDSTNDGQALEGILAMNFEETRCDFIKAGDNVVVDLPAVEPGKVIKSVSLLTVVLGICATADNTTITAAHDYIPKYVLDRQKVFKLKWHGVVLLVLIAASPAVINFIYQDFNRENQAIEAQVERNQLQIQELSELQAVVLELDRQNNQLIGQMEQIDRLGSRSRLWTETFSIISNALDEIPSTWLTSLQESEQGFTIEGVSMFRNRIPEVVEIFHFAGVRQVAQIQVRERDFYRFTITVTEIVEDESIFDPLPSATQQVSAQGGTQ